MENEKQVEKSNEKISENGAISTSSTLIGLKANDLTVLGNLTTYVTENLILKTKKEEILPCHFNLKDPVDSFTGRVEFLSNLHTQIQQNDITIISHNPLKVISGLGGVGKTELVRKYVVEYASSYTNLIWINAENFDTMQTSFYRLAKTKLKIELMNPDGSRKQRDQILDEIWNKLLDQVTLIIFDNADNFDEIRNGRKNGIKSFLPQSVVHPKKRPFVLATSRNQCWGRHSHKVMTLEVFTEEESLEFIFKQLHLQKDDEIQLKNAKKLAQILGGLPLALQQAVAYIRETNESRRFSSHAAAGSSYTVAEYIDEFEKEKERRKLLKFTQDHADVYEETVLTTWNISLAKIRKIQTKTFGGQKIAEEMISLMSFLNADDIPLKFIFHIMTNSHDNDDSGDNDDHDDLLQTSLNLLYKYALVNWSGGDVIGIHRLVQHVVRQNLEKNKETRMLTKAMERCSDFLEDIFEIPDDHSPAILENMLSILQKFGGDEAEVSYEQLKYDLSLRFADSGNLEKGEMLMEQLRSKVITDLGMYHENTILLHKYLGVFLKERGQIEEALILFRVTMTALQLNNLMDTIDAAQVRELMANCVAKQGRSDEATEMYEEAIEISEQILGNGHIQTISTKINMAAVLHNMGRREEALKIIEKIKNNIPADDDDTKKLLNVQQAMAVFLDQEERHDEAAEMMKTILEKKEHHFGKKHLETLNGMESLASILVHQGSRGEALEMYQSIFEQRRRLVGDNANDTVDTLKEMGRLCFIQKDYQGALEASTKCYELFKNKYGAKHPDALNSLKIAAFAEVMLGHKKNAVQMLNEVQRWGSQAGDVEEGDSNTLRIITFLNLLPDEEDPVGSEIWTGLRDIWEEENPYNKKTNGEEESFDMLEGCTTESAPFFDGSYKTKLSSANRFSLQNFEIMLFFLLLQIPVVV